MNNAWLGLVLGLVVGIAATVAFQSYRLSPVAEEAEEHADDVERGPHGGQLLHNDLLTLEVTIFEEGVPPHYRIYPSTPEGEPLRPTDVQLTGALERIGGETDRLTFSPEADYLRSNEVVGEPHSFIATFTASTGRRSSELRYEQIEGRTVIADDALASSGIEVATASGGEVALSIELSGELVLPPSRQVSVAARAPGVVSDVRAGVGDAVAAGDVLAVITSPALASAVSAHAAALARLEFAQATRDREADLVERRITARQDLQLAEQAFVVARADVAGTRETLRGLGLDDGAIAALIADPASSSRLPVKAPAAGVVTEQAVASGETVDGGQPLMTVTDTREVWANAQVHARDLAQVRRGRRVTVRAVGAPLETTGTVATVSPLVGDDTRTATARVVLSNADGRWQPGLFVTVEVALDTATADVVVPVDAVQTFRDWSVVFVRYGDTFEARPVELGRSDGRQVEILSGLRPGEQYAAVNAYAVKADVLKSGASHDH